MALPETITVKVTRDHIHRGIPVSTSSCPIALAAKELFLSATWVAVTCSQGITVYRVCDYYAIPHAAKEFIRLFDSGLPVEPFEFTTTLIGSAQ